MVYSVEIKLGIVILGEIKMLMMNKNILNAFEAGGTLC